MLKRHSTLWLRMWTLTNLHRLFTRQRTASLRLFTKATRVPTTTATSSQPRYSTV
nr:MAG TPA: hypothetical protein [Caudoviricetes sp.]